MDATIVQPSPDRNPTGSETPMRKNAITNRPEEVQSARNTLRRKGYTQKEAAGLLGVTREHLTLVLGARRFSRRILKAIEDFPENPRPA